MTSAAFPHSARAVVIGGGVIGCSVAYHLVKLGWRDVVLLEQGRLTCGTTWHAAGLVGQLRAHQNMTRLVQYSASLYQKLEAETGQATGWKQCGSVLVARTPERVTLFRRIASQALAKGARMGGARIFERTRVTAIHNRNGIATGVATTRGDIKAEVVINCAGQWAKQVGRMAGVTVPLHSAEHMYIVTGRIDGVHPDLPVL